MKDSTVIYDIVLSHPRGNRVIRSLAVKDGKLPEDCELLLEEMVDELQTQDKFTPKRDCKLCFGTGRVPTPNGADDFDYEPCECSLTTIL